MEVLHRTEIRRGSASWRAKDAITPSDFLVSKVVGEGCEHRNLVAWRRGCQSKLSKNQRVAPPNPEAAGPRTARRSSETLERETGFEPATLSLEG